ncbi:MAG: DUF72 domain-containing protein [Fimbriimonadaceae bacterium]|nr:DUF72 domain-containing protein [Fimbriimonadaceae bacterium]
MIRLGTSGYSYQDWHPHFYPAGLPAGRRLAYYAQHFGCVELNASFYRQPTAAAVARQVATVPTDFRFAVKAYGGITHDSPCATRGDFAVFAAALQPCRDAGQLGAVLAQFPNSFRPTAANTTYLQHLRERWADLPVVVEFRHSAWDDPRYSALLAELGLASAVVDLPPLAGLPEPLVKVTARPAYLRFHGRNAAQWYQHDQAWERYDYRYTRAELREWVPRIKTLAAEADDLYVFFNNHYEAQAVLNAQELAVELGLSGAAESFDGEQ